MLRIGLPKAAVLHACHRDNIDPIIFSTAILDGDFTSSIASACNNEQQANNTDTHRRTRLHWEPLSRVGERSVWAILDRDEEFARLNIDEDEFAELFQQEKEVTNSSKRRLDDSQNTSAQKTVRIIDQKRANNGGIVLASLKRPYSDVVKDIDRMYVVCAACIFQSLASHKSFINLTEANIAYIFESLQ